MKASSLGKSESCTIEFKNSSILISNHPSVACPNYYSHSLIEIIQDLNFENERILDFGCGTGFLSVILLKYFKNISADLIDLNKHAIDISRLNLTQNHKLNGYNLIHSNGYNYDYNSTYDRIFVNPPQLPSSTEDKSYVISGGYDGLYHIKKIITLASTILKPRGKLYMVLADYINDEEISLFCKKYSFKFKIIYNKKAYTGIATKSNLKHIESLGKYKFNHDEKGIFVKIRVLEFSKIN